MGNILEMTAGIRDFLIFSGFRAQNRSNFGKNPITGKI